MLGKHLPERIDQIRIRLFQRITNMESGKLSTPITNYPFAIGSAVHRSKYWTVLGEMDRPKPFYGFQRSGGFFHRQTVLIRQGQVVLAPFADEQVFFDVFQVGI